MRLTILLLISFFLCSLSTVGQEQQKLSKKELKTLIATATTAEDHLRIAKYYRRQEQLYLASQKEHEAEEKDYINNRQRYSAKYPFGAAHCRQWAYNDGQSAKQARALAELHERMAKEAAER